jgi:hypothetical protein
VDEGPPDDEPAEVTDAQLRATGAEPPLNATEGELDEAVRRYDPAVKHETGGADIDAAKGARHGRKGSRILGFFKGTSKGGIKTAIGTDTVRAKVLGSRQARERLGVVPPRRKAGGDDTSGPVEFRARYDGKKGHVYLGTAATPAVVAFSTETHEDLATNVTAGGDAADGAEGDKDREEKRTVHAMWSVAVADIVEIKKFGGYGWEAKLLVGWSLERRVEDGLEIRTGEGRSFRITACPLRDELFNRLIAMGGQKWEAW